MQQHHKTLIIAAIVVGGLVYAGLNVWIFVNAKKITGSPQTVVSEIIRNVGKSVSALFPLPSPKGGVPPVINTDKSMTPGYVPQAKTSPTPTPPPKNGPKSFACSKEGVCNLYSDQALKEFCTVTYADPTCLGQCSDTSKRCRR